MTHSCACVAHGPRFAHTATQNMRQRQAKKKNQRERERTMDACGVCVLMVAATSAVANVCIAKRIMETPDLKQWTR